MSERVSLLNEMSSGWFYFLHVVVARGRLLENNWLRLDFKDCTSIKQ